MKSKSYNKKYKKQTAVGADLKFNTLIIVSKAGKCKVVAPSVFKFSDDPVSSRWRPMRVVRLCKAKVRMIEFNVERTTDALLKPKV